jgi:hypothetical protein
MQTKNSSVKMIECCTNVNELWKALKKVKKKPSETLNNISYIEWYTNVLILKIFYI